MADDRVCPICRIPITTEIKRQLKTSGQIEEFQITGMCANCQEAIYGRAPGENEAGRGGTIDGSNNWRKEVE